MRVSGSRLWLLAHCGWSFRDDVTLPYESEKRAASTGKLYHALIEQAMKGSKVKVGAVADVQKAAKLFAAWKKWWPGYAGNRLWRAEVPYVYDWETDKARELPHDWVHGERLRGPTEIPFIIDALTLDGPEVLDHKSGQSVGSVRHSPQLIGAALCMARVHDVPEVRATIAYPRIRKPFVVDTTVIDVLRLESFAAKLRARLQAVPDSRPCPGEWCFRCPARPVCPAGPGKRRLPVVEGFDV